MMTGNLPTVRLTDVSDSSGSLTAVFADVLSFVSSVVSSVVLRLMACRFTVGPLVVCLPIVGLPLTTAEGWAAEPLARGIAGAEPPAADVAAIRVAAAAYREALAKGDAAAIRKAWTADGDIVDGWGNLLPAENVVAATGRPADELRPEVRVSETRLRFIAADVAIEDGAVDVVLPGTKTPIEGWFSAIWARREGEWRLASIREAERPGGPQTDTLEDLDWLVGDWALVPDARDKRAAEEATADRGKAAPAITMRVRWDAARMFLLRDVRQAASAEADQPPAEIQQRIGWDPLVGRIRAWSFATDGSRSEATWFRDGNSWVVRGTSVHPDGRQTTTVNIYTYDNNDRCTWRTLEDPLESSVGLLTRATWVRQPEGPKR